MPPASTSATLPSAQNTTRLAMTPIELQKRAHNRLAERIDLAKTRHKPLSILRQEARRIVEQYLEVEWPTLGKVDRDPLVEDILAESVGFSPLEELFRDENHKEIMVLAANQVIAKRGDAWLPTSARFRDAGQYRSFLGRVAEYGAPMAAGSNTAVAWDVKLANGFRAIATVPPEVMNLSPVAHFLRIADANSTPSPEIKGSTVIGSTTRSIPSNTSGVIGFNPSRSGISSRETDIVPLSATRSGVIRAPMTRSGPELYDPLAKMKQKVTHRIVSSCAAAGMYDLSLIATAELQRIVAAHVGEIVELERLNMDDATKERLVLEILAAMNR